MATARLDLRLDEKIKEKAEKASTLLGLKSLTEYVVQLMDEDATKVLAEHETMILEDDVFDRFMAACDKAQKPNQALLDANKFAKAQGFE
jgi:uncharacterized protein (DUF1778 family)